MKPARLGLFAVVLLFFGYGSFGVAAPFFWGHNGYNGAVYMLRARMTWRHHTVDPLNWTGFDKPEPGALYYHHPVGGHHFLTLLTPIFGEVEWLPRACNLLFGLVTILAIFAIGRRFFSPRVGVLAALAWVTLPDIVSFSTMYDPMFLEMAAVLWLLYAWLAMWEERSWRPPLLAAAAVCLGGLMMWEVFFVSPVLAFVGLGLALGRSRRDQRVGRLHVAWAFSFAAGAAVLAAAGLHLYLAWKAGGLHDMQASYQQRSGAGGMSLSRIYSSHAEWMRILYGIPPLVIGGLWLVGFFVRLFRGRAEKRDAVPLTFLLTNLLYIKLFAEGSAVHLYRVSFFSCFFAFAAADVTERTARFFEGRGRSAPRALLLGLAPYLLYQAFELPHAYRNLLESRATSSTHNGAAYNSEQHKLLFFQEVAKRVGKDERVYIHYGQWGARKEYWYYLDRSFTNVPSLTAIPEAPGKAVAIFDESRLSPPERERFLRWASKHPVIFYDHFTIVDLRSNAPGVESYTWKALPMSAPYRWFVSHKQPPQEIVKQLYLPGACQLVELGVAPPASLPVATWPKDDARRICRQHLEALRDQPTAKQLADELVKDGVAPASASRSLGGIEVVSRQLTADKLRLVLIDRGAAKALPAGVRVRVMKQGIPKGDLPAPEEVPIKLPAPATMRPHFAYVEDVVVAPGMRVAIELVEPVAALGPPLPPAMQKKHPPDPPLQIVKARLEIR